MSLRANELLKKSHVIAGYSTYIDLIKNIIGNKKIIATGMTKEVERVEMAIAAANSGSICALVSGGDAGIYAMAGLVFEICRKKGLKLIRYGTDHKVYAEKSAYSESHKSESHKNEGILEIEIVPGIPALASGAALLGAPLTHDFAAVSLSDLLTPWETIEKRLEAAASADFVIVIYNPKSKKRHWQLAKAVEIILKYRDENTPVGIITAAMRENQKISIVPLKDMDSAEVGMQTTLFVGNSSSVQYLDFMYTPRGYAGKYKL